VIPSALFSFAVMSLDLHGQSGNTVTGLLWLSSTIAGYRMARQRRYAEHRKYMIYSFALCYQLLWGRVLYYVLPWVGHPLATDLHAQVLFLETASWIGFTMNLLLAQWWLEHTAKRGYPAV
jgi:hypothetical protein